MNIPEIYLVEPYNAYAPKGRKKHWHEVIEEQALLARILAEQQALQEAQSKTLPPNSPDIANPTVGNMAGGAGGTPVFPYFHPELEAADFSATPTNAIAGNTVTFTNLTPTPQFDTYKWIFGDGTTSTDVNPTHVYAASGSKTVKLEATSSNGKLSATKTNYVKVTAPTVTVNFSVVTSSNVLPITASFTNTSTTNGAGTLAYNWDFGNLTGSKLQNPTAYYTSSAEYYVRLSVTESNYNSASFKILVGGITASNPTVVAGFTATSASNIAPTAVTFTTTTTTTGTGALTSRWDFGDGSAVLSTLSASAYHIYDTGSFVPRLSVTESVTAVKDDYIQSGIALPAVTASAPSVTSGFTVAGTTVTQTAGYYTASAGNLLTFTATSTTNNGQPLTYKYLFMSGSAPADYSSSVAAVSTQTFATAGTYGVLLGTTGSYGIATAGVRNIQIV